MYNTVFTVFYFLSATLNETDLCPIGKCGEFGTCIQDTGICECRSNYTGIFCQNGE